MQGNSKELFSRFITGRKILIADPQQSSRSSIGKILVQLGCKTNQIEIAPDFNIALSQLDALSPSVVFSEYSLVNGNGLELSQRFSAKNPAKDKLFVLITSNSSQSLVAQAAEEDIDLYLLKPYTIQSFSENLVAVVLGKIFPSDYIQTIEHGKEYIQQGKFSEAIAQFEKATTLNPRPSLALFYRGQVELIQKLLGQAEGSYRGGLQYNDIHYKCITGLFDLLVDQKREIDAYEVVKKIASVFPANPARMAQVLTLAVKTGNLQDIESYYQSFLEIETRTDDLVKYICAALIICAKQTLLRGEKEKTKDLLNKAAVTCAGRPNLLKEIIATFVEAALPQEAQAALKRFPAHTHDSNHYKISQALVFAAQNPPPEQLYSTLQKVRSEGVRDLQLMKIEITALHALGRMDQAQEIQDELSRMTQ